VPISDVLGIGPARNRPELRCFEVLTAARPYYMIAESDSEFDAWVEAFARALENARQTNKLAGPGRADGARPSSPWGAVGAGGAGHSCERAG